ncbi:hypothetical protein RFI_23231 [Reticulomyxa filosa]|uniref:Uncharacterized protein n=1 Tax=Reticulomyxa filosa TaxID=46433 RepID=X6MJE8_RETFI|nr:hypothetical protein RFI_23231 [Reticulomyxa filosa]|eukprot:ETO14138.1 hypothetical protein RFI_23231 [Reticulomyxa filosa]
MVRSLLQIINAFPRLNTVQKNKLSYVWIRKFTDHKNFDADKIPSAQKLEPDQSKHSVQRSKRGYRKYFENDRVSMKALFGRLLWGATTVGIVYLFYYWVSTIYVNYQRYCEVKKLQQHCIHTLEKDEQLLNALGREVHMTKLQWKHHPKLSDDLSHSQTDQNNVRKNTDPVEYQGLRDVYHLMMAVEGSKQVKGVLEASFERRPISKMIAQDEGHRQFWNAHIVASVDPFEETYILSENSICST